MEGDDEYDEDEVQPAFQDNSHVIISVVLAFMNYYLSSYILYNIETCLNCNLHMSRNWLHRKHYGLVRTNITSFLLKWTVLNIRRRSMV